MEDAEQVLAMAGIDAGLATDGGIHLRQKRGRDLHEAHAAPHDAGRKACEIADHAAAKRDHRVIALDTGRKHHVADGREMIEALGLLAGRSVSDTASMPSVCRLSIKASR